jgi:hypothetical protein
VKKAFRGAIRGKRGPRRGFFRSVEEKSAVTQCYLLNTSQDDDKKSQSSPAD